jgi:hypothetical protein
MSMPHGVAGCSLKALSRSQNDGFNRRLNPAVLIARLPFREFAELVARDRPPRRLVRYGDVGTVHRRKVCPRSTANYADMSRISESHQLGLTWQASDEDGRIETAVEAIILRTRQCL